ncbi:MAG: hypothetical protein OES57_11820, partial [Acidimicrobiia bacterium]|nr:hypothetical protein [Acidimicrobiia bacterium]
MPETNDEIRRRPSDGTWLRLGIVLAVVGPLFALAAFWEPQAGTTRDIDPRNGQAFIQDNLWTAADGQYAVWVDDAANPIVGRRDGSDEWRTVDLGEVAGNPFAAPTV